MVRLPLDLKTRGALYVTDTVLDSAAEAASRAFGVRHGVVGTIDPHDWIFWFIYNHPGIANKTDAFDLYFSGGADCAGKLRTLIAEQRPIEGLRLLEFAAGYGRVTRHLGKTLPGAEILACDIHSEAVDFLQDTIKVSAKGSHEVPELFNLNQRFDVVFALSFFSHLPPSTWRRWLLALTEHAAPGGLVIFTTHGERSREKLGNPAIDRDGFWFKPISEQRDLPGNEYGSSITLPNYVLGQVLNMAHMQLVRFQEGFWWEHQDVYVLRRNR